MKFIHTGDIHWGMSPDSDKPWSRERSRDIRDTFTAIIAKAKELRVDCLFIAGDLFHRQPLLRDLKEVNYLFSTIPQTQVIIIAGNHDRIRKNSAVLSFSWASNVTFLESEDVSSVYFEDINTEVTGFSYYTAEEASAARSIGTWFASPPCPSRMWIFPSSGASRASRRGSGISAV